MELHKLPSAQNSESHRDSPHRAGEASLSAGNVSIFLAYFYAKFALAHFLNYPFRTSANLTVIHLLHDSDLTRNYLYGSIPAEWGSTKLVNMYA